MKPIVNEHDISEFLKTDEIFVTIHNLYGSPPNWSRPQGFITLSKIILEQQVSLQSANAHFNKLNTYLPAFTPEEILQLSDDEMRSCQISKQKSTYLRALSSAILDGNLDLDGLSEFSVAGIRERLKSIKGIGDWTADIYLLFCLQAKDILPIGDIAVVNTIRELTDAVSTEEIIKYSERWKPYRSLGTYFLWHYYLSKRKRTSVL
jgi:DNA-3-methyladenine glycosylase II